MSKRPVSEISCVQEDAEDVASLQNQLEASHQENRELTKKLEMEVARNQVLERQVNLLKQESASNNYSRVFSASFMSGETFQLVVPTVVERDDIMHAVQEHLRTIPGKESAHFTVVQGTQEIDDIVHSSKLIGPFTVVLVKPESTDDEYLESVWDRLDVMGQSDDAPVGTSQECYDRYGLHIIRVKQENGSWKYRVEREDSEPG
eukprot:TRINITY_DN53436_c0_g1_i1.p1 TRINITY_DN53436_c0_g1~~TRINITY_DN53436_c0_g1_i1.p1  ORF type:complete len:204 (+),score=43.67 TRINITY_DN53436_c0_g1_i1:164-775(+)